MMYLNVGCGGHVAPHPWVNIDRSLGTRHFPCHPDVVADIRCLPFDDNIADVAYLGHVLEHLKLETVETALREVRRVLTPDGRLCVVGPDYDRAVSDFPEMCESIWPGTFGEWASWSGAGHQWCATATNSLELVKEVFPHAKEIAIADVDPFWPAVSSIGWQFALMARKEH